MSEPSFSITPHSFPDFPEAWPAVVLGEFTVPRTFTATGRHQDFTIELEVEVDDRGRPHCRRLAVSATGDGSDVTGDTLRRLPVAKLVGEATTEAALSQKTPRVKDPRGVTLDSCTAGPLTSNERSDFYGRFAQGARRPHRGSPVTDENLRQVADLYRAALERGDPPTKTIGLELHIGRSTAARWVAEARKRGLLGPALRGRAGEVGRERS
jgi:hypothetical protein